MAQQVAGNILFVTSECFPLIKTGGLADVAGALPLALSAGGKDVRVLLPAFPDVMAAAKEKKKVATIAELFGGKATLYEARSGTGLKLFLLEASHLFELVGNPYLDEKGRDRSDNHLRFAALSYAAAKLAMGKLVSWKADIVHAHDWQAGLTPAYLSLMKGDKPKTVFTIHNLAFQGLFPKSRLASLKLPKAMFGRDGLEYWDKISFLKAGLVYSDHITTVSPSYAAEISTEEGGMGMGGLLHSLGPKLSGILNGIDTTIWDPATDPTLKAPYSVSKPAAKAKNKRALQRELGLDEDPDAPLFCVISRLTEQKGLDLLLDAIPHIVGNGAQLAVLGSGDKKLEQGYGKAAHNHSAQIGVTIGYDEALAHRLQAGADAIFIPSRFEPCGLTQLCAMRYGTLPVVARVGGLADTVIDANAVALQAGLGTGFQFAPVTQDALRTTVDRVLQVFANKRLWRKLMRNAMKQDVSWRAPAHDYAKLYDALAGTQAEGLE